MSRSFSLLLLALAILTTAALTWRGGGWGGSEAPAGSGAPMVEVALPDLAGAALDGKALFDANCAVCHGPNAAGRDGVAPPLVHRIYEPGHHADYAFFRAVVGGVRQHHWPFGDMPPVRGVDESQVARIVAYVRALQRANGIH